MDKPEGRIATFYSYKGGVGRSFLLSNTATLLAQWGYRVLCVDWDLEAPGLHYYFRPHLRSPETGLVEMVLGVRDERRVDPLGHITPVVFPDGSGLDLIAAGGVGCDYIPNVQGIDWDALYSERSFGDVLEEWRQRWIESYDVVLVDSRTGISDSGGICTAQLPHILAYAFTANQQNVDGVLDVVTRAAEARNGLPYDRSRLVSLPLLCRFDMTEEYERASEWREKLRAELKPSYDSWVPEGAAFERVLDHCTVPYSAYWSFGEELPVLTEDFRNPQLVSYSIASIAALIARNLGDVRLFTESRDAYVDAAVRTGLRGGHYRFDVFLCGAPNTAEDVALLSRLLEDEGITSYSSLSPDEDPHTAVDTCRHFILVTRDTVGSHQRTELNYFLRQSLEEQTDRALFPVITPRDVLRDLPPIVKSIQPYILSEATLSVVARAIKERIRDDGALSTVPSPDEVLCLSYASADRAWAEWVAWQLRDVGHTVRSDVVREETEDEFFARLERPLGQIRDVVLFSQAYFTRRGLTPARADVMLGARERLVPLRIDGSAAPAPLRRLPETDLSGLDGDTARAELLRAVGGPVGVASDARAATVRRAPRLPGSRPPVWNVPPRPAHFVGRDDLLAEIRTRLTAEGRPEPVLALTGRVGVGKTQLAVEYAYRFSGAYAWVWWVDATRPVPAQLAALAVAAGWADSGATEEAALRTLHEGVRTRPGWLLVFDGADDPAELARRLPPGEGHVLITSRDPLWHQIASPVDVDVLDRTASTALLRSRNRALDEGDADRLASALDDLPLALAQGAEALHLFTPEQYLQQLEDHADAAVSDGTPFDYDGPLSAQLVYTLSLLERQDLQAAQLVLACALLAPEPFPLYACATGGVDAGETGDAVQLVRRLSDPRVFRRILTAVERSGLARVAGGSIQVHRLTQAVLRDQLTAEERAEAIELVGALLAAAYPGEAADPRTWPRWTELLPHLLALDPADLATQRARYAACEACWYLLDRDDTGTALPRLEDLHRTWTRQFGADAEDTLFAAAYLARAHAATGDYAEAVRLEEDLLARRRERLGENDPLTLRVAGNLATRLSQQGLTEEARELAERTLEAQRRVLGEDHPDTLHSAGNLAIYLAEQGLTEEAHELAERTFEAQRRVLGEDHPDTLLTASNLAIYLDDRGETESARALAEDTLARQRRVLGEDHIDTRHTAEVLNDASDTDQDPPPSGTPPA
ncbi:MULTISPECIES: FxSxx-COOH system tetratricopeptide repeat protein [unclassified Streptomyces]|uniref:FxSxx-COOH system tetratricopeptide repeat protein n=1 Tax=unclassified Streptomyces TaxID=2593676 RepID=UPI0036EEB5E9